jgi:hypothetical protein
VLPTHRRLRSGRTVRIRAWRLVEILGSKRPLPPQMDQEWQSDDRGERGHQAGNHPYHHQQHENQSPNKTRVELTAHPTPKVRWAARVLVVMLNPGGRARLPWAR